MDPDLLGWLASVAFLVRLLPQPVRLWRTGVPDGVSPLAAWNAVLCETGWLVYGFTSGLAPVLWVSVACLVPAIWTVVLLRSVTRRSDVLWASLWLVVLVVTGLTGTLGVVLGLSVVVIHGPQVLKALRESDLAGIAPMTYVLALIDASLWGAYGVAVGDGALVAYAVVLTMCAVVILARVAWYRRTVAATVVVAEAAVEVAPAPTVA